MININSPIYSATNSNNNQDEEDFSDVNISKVSTKLEECTWREIAAVSRAGKAREKFSIGDKKTLFSHVDESIVPGANNGLDDVRGFNNTYCYLMSYDTMKDMYGNPALAFAVSIPHSKNKNYFEYRSMERLSDYFFQTETYYNRQYIDISLYNLHLIPFTLNFYSDDINRSSKICSQIRIVEALCSGEIKTAGDDWFSYMLVDYAWPYMRNMIGKWRYNYSKYEVIISSKVFDFSIEEYNNLDAIKKYSSFDFLGKRSHVHTRDDTYLSTPLPAYIDNYAFAFCI